MPALSFSDPTAPDLIRSGTKRSTIRPFTCDRVMQFKKADILQLWYRQRSDDRAKIADVKRMAVHLLRLEETHAMLPQYDKGFIPITPEQSDELAQRDGFSTYKELFNCLAKTYGGPKAITDQLWMLILWHPPYECDAT